MDLNRGPSAYQPNVLPLGQTSSLGRLNEWLAFHNAFWISTEVVYLQHYLLVTGLVPHETTAVSAHVLCAPYNHAPVYSVTSFETTGATFLSLLLRQCIALSVQKKKSELKQMLQSLFGVWTVTKRLFSFLMSLEQYYKHVKKINKWWLITADQIQLQIQSKMQESFEHIKNITAKNQSSA